MKIVIIEDEMLVAQELADSLMQIDPDIEIVALLGSVKEAVDYFNSNAQPDLIFSDIQLGDGLSFEIGATITIQVPVIFCTAFNEYALEAFKANGIEYILKPFSTDALKQALAKFEAMQKVMAGAVILKYEAAIEILLAKKQDKSDTIMVKYRDRLLPFTLNKIALFYLENEITYIHTHLGKTYSMAETLEELEKKTRQTFFRMNRQFLVNRNVIQDATEHFPRKLRINLLIPFDRQIIVSKEKKGKLLDWLTR